MSNIWKRRFLAAALAAASTAAAIALDDDVESRVSERLDGLLQSPINAAALTAAFRKFGGFPNDMRAADRDQCQRHLYSQLMVDGLKVYYGLEDGLFLSYEEDRVTATYREPGQSGYRIITTASTNSSSPSELSVANETIVLPAYMEPYHDVCINSVTGERELCIMEPGSMYIECPGDDCESSLVPCNDEETQARYTDCKSQSNATEPSDLSDKCLKDDIIKWCRSYSVKTLSEEDALEKSVNVATGTVTNTVRGFVPRSVSCVDSNGQMSQEPGSVLTVHPDNPFLNESSRSEKPILGSCLYKDGVTTVSREIVGPYAYCGENMNNGGGDRYKTCKGAFTGAFQSLDYDPRYRSWYTLVKESQRVSWSEPYIFFLSLKMGITLGHPIYSIDSQSGRTIFAGVLGIDYQLDSISKFLRSEYYGKLNVVAVVDDAAPNYLIGVSTGAEPIRMVIVGSNPPQACPPDNSFARCEPVRVPISELGEYDDDRNSKQSRTNRIVQRAFEAHRLAGFPLDTPLTVKESGAVGSDAYVTWTHVYEKLHSNLKWRFIVVSPAVRSNTDAISIGDQSLLLIVILCLLGCVGFFLCSALGFVFYRKRKEEAIIHADWRFTLAFIAGCSLLNLSSLAYLGENTDELCMLRMWLFHSLFAIAISPLLVKVWRMYRILEKSERMTRKIVTNTTAALYTLPLIAIQLIILLIFALVDPPKSTEWTDTAGVVATEHITCEHKTVAFFATQLAFSALIVLIGCLLAYLTRNMDPKFGESKQLIFALYNIAFTGIIIIVITNVVDMGQSSEHVIQAIGVFWATLFSSSAFVLPRLMEVKRNRRMSRSRSTIRVSGLDFNVSTTALDSATFRTPSQHQ